MWADECQKTFLPVDFPVSQTSFMPRTLSWEPSSPSGCSKSSSSSLQLFSRGRVRSHSSPSTMEMTVRSNSDLEMPLAMEPGVVSHEIPFSSFPLGKEMVISSRGCAAPTSVDYRGNCFQAHAPAISASWRVLIWSKMSRRCWMNSGVFSSCSRRGKRQSMVSSVTPSLASRRGWRGWGKTETNLELDLGSLGLCGLLLLLLRGTRGEALRRLGGVSLFG